MRTGKITLSSLKVGDEVLLQTGSPPTIRTVAEKEQVYPFPKAIHKGALIVVTFDDTATRYAGLPNEEVSIVIG